MGSRPLASPASLRQLHRARHRPTRSRAAASLTLVVSCLAHATASEPAADPPPDRSSIELHGVTLPDAHLGLEDSESAATRQFTAAEDERFARELASWPTEDLERRIAALQAHTTDFPPLFRGGRAFALSVPGTTGGSAPAGMTLTIEEGEQRRVLVGPRTLAPDERLTRFFAPSPSGARVVVRVARAGSRWSTARVVRVADGTVEEELRGLHNIDPDVAWLPDESGFVYVRRDEPAPGTGTSANVGAGVLTLHRRGTPQQADPVLLAAPGEDDRWFTPHVAADGTLAVLTGRGTSPPVELRLQRPGEASWRTVERVGELRARILGEHHGQLVVETDRDAPNGRVVALDLQSGELAPLVAEPAHPLVHAAWAPPRVVAMVLRDGRPELRLHALDGRLERTVELPAGTISWGPPWGPGLTATADGGAVFLNLSGLADPGTLHRLDAASGALTVYRPRQLAHDPDRFETRHEVYASRDGTRVPIAITTLRDDAGKPTLQRSARPTILYVYGALGWTAFPFFQPQMIAFLEGGGAFAIAGVRGGGEHGEPWHAAGIRDRRENAIADVHAAAQWLVQQGWTSRQQLVLQGSSLGSALAAISVVRRPDLFGAALVDLPVLDLVRYPTFTGGHLWKGEIGDASRAEELWPVVHASPYHQLRPGTCYPPVLLTAGTSDEVAAPAHALKFTAALRAAQACDNRVLLQRVEGAGHSYGSDAAQAARTWARQLAFVRAVTGGVSGGR